MIVQYSLTQSVDTESPQALAALGYVLKHTGVDTFKFSTYLNSAPNAGPNGEIVEGMNELLGGIYTFEKGSSSAAIDAGTLILFPENSLKGLRSALGLPVLSPFPQFADETVPDIDPVGDPWPAHGANIWKVSADFLATPDKWPEGAKFDKRVGGRTLTFTRIRVKTAAGTGWFGTAVYAPAWTA